MYDICSSSKFLCVILCSMHYFLIPELILVNQYEEYIFFYLFNNNKNIRTV